LQAFDVGADHEWPDLIQGLDVPFITPSEKSGHGLSLSRTRVFIPTARGEELDELPGCLLAGSDDEGRQCVEAGAGQLGSFRNPNLLAIRLGREGDLTGTDTIPQSWTARSTCADKTHCSACVKRPAGQML
jgi:hypothetical protein